MSESELSASFVNTRARKSTHAGQLKVRKELSSRNFPSDGYVLRIAQMKLKNKKKLHPRS